MGSLFAVTRFFNVFKILAPEQAVLYLHDMKLHTETFGLDMPPIYYNVFISRRHNAGVVCHFDSSSLRTVGQMPCELILSARRWVVRSSYTGLTTVRRTLSSYCLSIGGSVMSSQRNSPAFMDEAVRQVLDQRYSVPEVADRLGVPAHSLYKWVKAVSQMSLTNRQPP